MSNISSAVASLKAKEGLPHTDVNRITVSSTVTGANNPAQNVQSTPDQKLQTAREVLAEVTGQQAQQQPEPVKDDRIAEILAAKDAAIEDAKTRAEQFQKSSESLQGKLTELIEKMGAKPEPQGQKEPALPGLPEGIDSLPAEQQLRALQEAYKNSISAVEQRFNARDQAIRGLLGPVLNEVRETAAYKDRMSVRETFPLFDYDKYTPNIEKLKKELPGLKTLEACALIAAREDPNMLRKPEKQAPSVEGSLPSMRAATDRQTVNTSTPEKDRTDIIRDLGNAIVGAHQKGNRNQANRLVDQLLRLKVVTPK